MPGERGESNFALLHARYVLVPSYRELLNAKLVFWCVQLRQLHGALARVKALDAGATLMQSSHASRHCNVFQQCFL